jgi:hypothetical protein
MATFNGQVNSSAGDARQAGATVDLTSSEIYFGSSVVTVGLFFPSVTIPPGSTITSAILEGYFSSTSYDSGTFTAACEDADSAAIFTSDDKNVSNRTPTSATVAVSLSNVMTSGSGFYGICDLKDAVQEVIDRPGWSSGNNIAALLYSLTSGEIRFRTYDNNSAEAAKLTITYTAPASGAAKKRKLRQGTRFGARAGT